jgi:hypothetical protein
VFLREEEETVLGEENVCMFAWEKEGVSTEKVSALTTLFSISQNQNKMRGKMMRRSLSLRVCLTLPSFSSWQFSPLSRVIPKLGPPVSPSQPPFSLSPLPHM